MSVVQSAFVAVGHSGGVLFGSGVGVVPVVSSLEEGVMEGGVIGSGDIVVLVRQPSVPFRGNHVAIGAAH